MESAASGLLAAINLYQKLQGGDLSVPDNTTVLGALSAHISAPNENFQPMNANFGILKPLNEIVRDKKRRYALLAERAIENIKVYKGTLL